MRLAGAVPHPFAVSFPVNARLMERVTVSIRRHEPRRTEWMRRELSRRVPDPGRNAEPKQAQGSDLSPSVRKGHEGRKGGLPPTMAVTELRGTFAVFLAGAVLAEAAGASPLPPQ